MGQAKIAKGGLPAFQSYLEPVSLRCIRMFLTSKPLLKLRAYVRRFN